MGDGTRMEDGLRMDREWLDDGLRNCGGWIK